jgi:death-on-curing protein
LSVEDVIALHDLESSAPLIDRGKLEGAVWRPQAGFGDQMTYKSIWTQASVLIHGICQAHAFLDGNKRCAWLSAVTFLAANGIELIYIYENEMAEYVKEIAQHVHSEEDTAFWFAARIAI